MKCTYIVRNADGSEAERGEYWRLGDKVRVRQAVPNASNTWLLDSRVVRVDDMDNSTNRRSVSGTIAPRIGHSADTVWGLAMFVFTSPNHEFHTFDALLTRVPSVRGAKRVTLEGRDYAYVEVKHEVCRLELWFDPSVNYLVKKVIAHIDRPAGSKVKKQRLEGIATGFKEVARGLYFPERVVVESFDDDVSVHRTEREFMAVKFNEPIPDEIFEVRYPPGAEISDTLSGRVVRADEQGRLMEIPGPRGELARGRPLETASSAGSKERQTESEPIPTSRWILPASLCLLFVVVLFSVVRLVRQRATSS